MKRKQLFYLFVCNFVIWFIGMGLLPILPLYASQFGATQTGVGLYLAFTYLAITVGTLLTSWLADRLGYKRAFISAGVIGIPALVLLGQATAFWQVILLTAIVWFVGGIGLALVSVFTGLYADHQRRGKSFGLTWLAFPLAAVIGGASIGQLLTWQGYPLMFIVLAAVWAGWPVVGLLGLAYEPLSIPAQSTAITDKSPLRFERAFYMIWLVALLSAMTIYASRLGESLSMQSLNFGPGAIASTTVAGGLVTIPVTLLLGTLSDRLGRKNFLILGYLLAAGGALILSTATELWHFWLASGLMFTAMCVNGSVVPAYVTDLLAPAALSRGLPWVNAATRIAGIIGFAGAGYLIDNLGATGLYFIAAATSVMAAILLALPQRKRPIVPLAQPRWRKGALRS